MLPHSDDSRLAKTIRLFDSPVAGERAAALEAACRQLETLGLSWADITAKCGGFVGERKTDCERQASTDDRVAAIEALAGVEDMHGATAPAACPFGFAIHLGHHVIHRNAASKRMAVLAVGGDDCVLLGKCLHRSDCDCFFTDIEMKKAADLLLGIKFRAFLLKAADADHLS